MSGKWRCGAGAGAILPALLVFFAGGIAAQESPPLVEVTGSGEVFLAPDHATLGIGVRVQEGSAEEAAAVMSTRIASVVDTLVALGLSRDSLPTEVFAIAADRDFREGSRISGYSANVILEVRTTELERLADFVGAAIAAGATEVGRVEFGSSETRAAHAEALRLAVRAAEDDARVIAEARGSRLGPMIRITTAPERRGGVMLRGVSSPVAAAALVPHRITVEASVVATWELAPGG